MSTFLFQVHTYYVYEELKRFGKIVSYRARDRSTKHKITFIRSATTDQLKHKYAIPVETGLVWVDWQSDKVIECTPEIHVAESLLVPPDQKSPQNIVNALPDNCLKKIFEYVDLFDLCELAQVCKRFLYAAQLADKPHHIVFHSDAPLWKWALYFSLFGESVWQIVTLRGVHSNILMGMVAKYCKQILEFNCFHGPDLGIKVTWPLMGCNYGRNYGNRPMTVDKLLKLVNRGDTASTTCSVNLYLKDSNLPAMVLPVLEEVRLTFSAPLDSASLNFFEVNPQIKQLEIDGVGYVDISQILERLPDIRELHLGWSVNNGFPCSNFAIFGQLKHLHTLEISSCIRAKWLEILNQIIDNNIQLKHLIIRRARYTGFNPITLICRIKSIVFLKVNQLTDDELLRIGTTCENLRGIDVGVSQLTLKGIWTMLQIATKLTKAQFFLTWVEDADEMSAQYQRAANVCACINALRRHRKIDVTIYIRIYSKDVAKTNAVSFICDDR